MNLLPEPYSPPVYDCGKCARCQAKQRKEKIKDVTCSILFAVFSLSASGFVWYAQAHPAPKTAEQIIAEKVQAEKEAKVDAAENALEEARADAGQEEDQGWDQERDY